MAKIFVIDDESNIRTMIQECLEAEGYQIQCFESAEEALHDIEGCNPDLIITDLVMPNMDGIELTRQAKALKPEINILLITAHASVESAVEAIRSGVCDYVLKPFKINDLLTAVRKALSQTRLMPKSGRKGSPIRNRYELKNLIGSTAEMQSIFKLIEKIAKTQSSVLIMGESGTGKEMVARALHYHSNQKKGPFVSINCAALPETLLEGELFGYEKGAFTGAASSKVGLLELAENGTFLLDEIGDMPTNLQVKLLRVLQERILKRLGGIRDIKVNFRLIAATSKNLIDEIKAKRFREDLFYRLNVIPIVLPTLRERKADIPIFAHHFLRVFAQKNHLTREIKLDDDAVKVLQNYQWPGNVRELENVIERLITLSENDLIDASTIDQALKLGSLSSSPNKSIQPNGNLRESIETYERELIENAISEANGNQNKAAQKLQLTRQALQYKLKKYGFK